MMALTPQMEIDVRVAFWRGFEATKRTGTVWRYLATFALFDSPLHRQLVAEARARLEPAERATMAVGEQR